MKNNGSYSVVSEWLEEYKTYIKNHHRPTFSRIPIVIILVVGVICYVVGPVLMSMFFKTSWIFTVYYATVILGFIAFSLFENTITTKIKKVDLSDYKNYCDEMYKSFSLIQKKDAQYITNIINRAQSDLDKSMGKIKENRSENMNLFCVIVIGAILAIVPQVFDDSSSFGVLTFVHTVAFCQSALIFKDLWLLLVDIFTNRDIRQHCSFITDLQYIVDTHFSFPETLKANSCTSTPSKKQKNQ